MCVMSKVALALVSTALVLGVSACSSSEAETLHQQATARARVEAAFCVARVYKRWPGLEVHRMPAVEAVPSGWVVRGRASTGTGAATFVCHMNSKGFYDSASLSRAPSA